jgi:hypothetical protein
VIQSARDAFIAGLIEVDELGETIEDRLAALLAEAEMGGVFPPWHEEAIAAAQAAYDSHT